MKYSGESLIAFAEAAALGSFSDAARQLGKSQSSISTAIANLEADFGLLLFDRSARRPVLTPAGQMALAHVRQILAASDRLDRTARQVAGGLEARLRVAWSETYHPDRFEALLGGIERRYPDLAFEALLAHDDGLVALVQGGRADIGIVAAQPHYPPDIGFATIAAQSEATLFVAPVHPLAALRDIGPETLAQHRELRLGSPQDPAPGTSMSLGHRVWSASSYPMLMDMAVQGFGWAALPRWMVTRFAEHKLFEIDARGWPRRVPVDAVWSRLHPPGQAGRWLLETLLAPADAAAG